MKAANQRHALMGRVHQLAKALGLSDASYRTLLICHTGKQSCADLDDEALGAVADVFSRMLRGDGPDDLAMPINLELPPTMRPTPHQWRTLDSLARSMGWAGLHDTRLLSFVERTTAAYSLEEMTRKAVSDSISGLMNWNKQTKAKRGTA
ncbi:phage protein GemA/Gp16 family protein [Burkholderia sp. LMG 21824]|uniref:phage protein GemA/Gp16 family protein n=1 Tax=Burkholderia sp. LMG 21824 TaxID=3158172 RepID=UPI003C2AAF5F